MSLCQSPNHATTGTSAATHACRHVRRRGDRARPATVSEGGFTSPNVTWLGHYAETAGVAEGGKLVGKTFFLTNNNQGLFAFDASDPEKPEQVGHLALLHGAENEDVATNGRILLLSQLGDAYHLSDGTAQQGLVSGDEAVTNTAPASYCRGPYPTIADISDEAAPKPIAAFELEINRAENCPASMDDGLLYSTHYTDVDDQRDARLGLFPMYNAGLRVADLSDPASPKELGYFNPPPDIDTKYGNTYGPQGDRIDLSGSNVRFKPDTGHIWFVSMTSGFHIVELGTGPPARLGLPASAPAPARGRRCATTLRVRVQAPRGQRLRSARIYVNGRLKRTVRGRNLRVPVTLRGLRGSRARVRIVASTRAGKRIVRSRTYKLCRS